MSKVINSYFGFLFTLLSHAISLKENTQKHTRCHAITQQKQNQWRRFRTPVSALCVYCLYLLQVLISLQIVCVLCDRPEGLPCFGFYVIQFKTAPKLWVISQSNNRTNILVLIIIFNCSLKHVVK